MSARAGDRVAAIDIGSNTLLLLVAEVGADGTLRPVVDECRFGRLGQGLARGRRLAPESVARSLEVLRDYRRLLDEAGARRIGVVGTQALREAEDAGDFTGEAEAILGAPVEIIAGEREAALVAAATTASFPELCAGEVVVADVGGASTEILVVAGGAVRSLVSVPIGAVKLSEQHLASDPATADEARALLAAVDEALAELALPEVAVVIGTAGTATSLATIEQKLLDYDPARVQGFRLDSASVDRLLARLLELTIAEKRRLRGLEPQRADVIAGGVAVYARLLRRIGAREIVVSDRGVRWGLAAELAA